MMLESEAGEYYYREKRELLGPHGRHKDWLRSRECRGRVGIRKHLYFGFFISIDFLQL